MVIQTESVTSDHDTLRSPKLQCDMVLSGLEPCDIHARLFVGFRDSVGRHKTFGWP